jgi:Tfp pilus assembly protein PilV
MRDIVPFTEPLMVRADDRLSTDSPATCGKGRPRRRGFTLFEALAASAVLAAGTLAVAMTINAAAAQSDYSLHAQRAAELSDDLMERVMALPYASATTLNNFSESVNNIKNAGGVLYPADYQKFSRSMTVVTSNQTVTGLGTFAGVTVTATVNDQVHNSWTLTRFIPQP